MKESEYKIDLSDEAEEKYDKIAELIDLGDFEEAEGFLDDFMEEHEHFVPALNKLAVINIYKNNLDRAEDILRDILEKDSEYAPAVTNLGSLVKEKGNKERAKKLYQKALEIDEEYGPAYNNLGVIFREEGNYSKSIKYLKKARKKGSMAYTASTDKPFYKEPGCIFMFVLAAAVIYMIYLILF